MVVVMSETYWILSLTAFFVILGSFSATRCEADLVEKIITKGQIVFGVVVAALGVVNLFCVALAWPSKVSLGLRCAHFSSI